MYHLTCILGTNLGNVVTCMAEVRRLTKYNAAASQAHCFGTCLVDEVLVEGGVFAGYGKWCGRAL